MRENYGTVVIYITGKETKEYRINAELAGTGAAMTLRFAYDSTTSALHIIWGSKHIKLDATTLGGTTNSDVFSNTASKQLGAFANVSTIFDKCSYTLDSTFINEVITGASAAEPIQ